MTVGSLHNLLAERETAPDFRVGDGATEIMWTDRRAYTVIARTPKTVTLRRDRAIRTDGLGMTDAQSYRYEADERGAVIVARLTKTGWKAGGHTIVAGRREYHDYCF